MISAPNLPNKGGHDASVQKVRSGKKYIRFSICKPKRSLRLRLQEVQEFGKAKPGEVESS